MEKLTPTQTKTTKKILTAKRSGQKYSNENLIKAVEDVQEGILSWRNAAEKYDVPAQKIDDCIHNKPVTKKVKSGDQPLKKLRMLPTMTFRDKEIFLTELKKHPIIYKISDYGEEVLKVKKAEAWNAITEVVNRPDLTSEFLRKKFIEFRRNFLRRKRMVETSTNPNEVQRARNWICYEMMEELIGNEINIAKNPSNLVHAIKESNEALIGIENALTELLNTHRKREGYLNSKKKNIDHLFFESCAKRMKNLPLASRSILKMQISQVFYNLENPHLPNLPITVIKKLHKS